MIAAGVLGSADLTSSESECGAPSVLLLRRVTVAPDLTVMSPGTNFCPSCRYSLILTLASPCVSIVFGFGLGAAASAGPATAKAATVARIGVRRSIRASWMRTASPASGKPLGFVEEWSVRPMGCSRGCLEPDAIVMRAAAREHRGWLEAPRMCRSGRTGILRRALDGGHPALEHVRQLVDRDAFLLQRVAVAQRDRAVLDRLVIDRD